MLEVKAVHGYVPSLASLSYGRHWVSCCLTSKSIGGTVVRKGNGGSNNLKGPSGMGGWRAEHCSWFRKICQDGAFWLSLMALRSQMPPTELRSELLYSVVKLLPNDNLLHLVRE
ncbi:unnamed protein product [Urochloa humidicola]